MSGSIFTNFIWRFLERCGAQGVAFIVSIALGRVIGPEIYGTVALVTVFTAVLQVFTDSGLANALIQKKDADDTDFSTVFYFNFATGLILYFAMYIAAPAIALFYDKPELVRIIRILSIVVVISSLKNVQQAYVSRNMLFRCFFFSTLGGTIISAVVGIVMAYRGFGVWALVFQHLINMAVDTLILWISVRWRPKLRFSVGRLKVLYSYGWKLLCSSLIDTLYNNMRQLVIGKVYTEESLASFNRGRQLPDFIVGNISTSIDSVLLPAMSENQDDKARVADMTGRAIKTGSFIIFPIMTGLAVCAGSLVPLLLTDKWLPCVPYMRIFCAGFALYPIHTANLNAIKAVGRSDVYLKLEIIKKLIGVTLFLAVVRSGPMAIAISVPVVSLISSVVNAFPCRRLIGYGYIRQAVDILPAFLLSAAMGAVVFALGFIPLPPVILLAVQAAAGVIIYTVGAYALKMESFVYILSVLKKLNAK